jgi:septal ring factor EnvC (AmiA/AmiB activator)
VDSDEIARRVAKVRCVLTGYGCYPPSLMDTDDIRALLAALDAATAERDKLRDMVNTWHSRCEAERQAHAFTKTALDATTERAERAERERDEAEAKLASLRCLVVEAQRDARTARTAALDEAIAVCEAEAAGRRKRARSARRLSEADGADVVELRNSERCDHARAETADALAQGLRALRDRGAR